MEKVNILLVDDRGDGIIALQSVLTDPEYNLVVANSGREALKHVLSMDFALILMDVQMPDMDGFETAALIKQRERSRDIPIIFVTAINKTDRFVANGYSAGAVDYLFKPIEAHILRSKVSVFVELFKKNRLIQQQSENLRDLERREKIRALSEMRLKAIRHYRNLADAMPQIVFWARHAGVMEYFNRFWHQYTQLDPNSSIGEGWRAAVHPAQLKEIDEKWAHALRHKIGFEMHCRFRNGQNGEYRWHLLRVTPDDSEKPNVEGWTGVAVEIHGEKTTQEQLLMAKRMAEAASETKSRFLANMSHEIRTPLGVILGFVELLADENYRSTDKTNLVSVIRRNGQLLSKIIDDILDLSKVEAGKLEVDRNELSIVDLLNGVKTFMSIPAEEKGIDLQVHIEGEVPKKILSNSMRLHQILVNIIGNGIKFSSQGKVVVTASLRREPKPLLHIIVQDSGPGLTAEQISNLFHAFTQGDSSVTRKFGGTGLGLVLSRKLARVLGGDVTISPSQPGEGCKVEITVETGPLDNVEMVSALDSVKAVSAAPPEPTEKATGNTQFGLSAHASGGSLEGMKVLLVEDSKDNQLLIRHMLHAEGADVSVAENGIEGVAKAKSDSYDVVLMDIQMPMLDGYGALAKLREDGYDRPVIALTAHGMVEDKKRSLESGFASHITKPVDRVSLIEQITAVVA